MHEPINNLYLPTKRSIPEVTFHLSESSTCAISSRCRRAVVGVDVRAARPGACSRSRNAIPLARTAAIMQREPSAARGQRLGHALDGRDADAARQQQRRAIGIGQRKQVARRADLDHIAHVQRIVHRLRSPREAGSRSTAIW